MIQEHFASQAWVPSAPSTSKEDGFQERSIHETRKDSSPALTYVGFHNRLGSRFLNVCLILWGYFTHFAFPFGPGDHDVIITMKK